MTFKNLLLNFLYCPIAEHKGKNCTDVYTTRALTCIVHRWNGGYARNKLLKIDVAKNIQTKLANAPKLHFIPHFIHILYITVTVLALGCQGGGFRHPPETVKQQIDTK